MADAPFMYWVGMNTPGDVSAQDLADFNDFYSNVHASEVLAANPGFFRATRYELAEQDARGSFGPRWLAVYEMESQAAADGYSQRNDGPPEGRPTYSPGPVAWQRYESWWRLIWHRLVPETGELGAGGAPYIYLVGMDVPQGTDAQGLRQFNDFYTRVHVPEVVAVNKFLSGIRYELHRDFRHPAPGSPCFLAVYEADEASLRARAERAANPGSATPLSSGPRAWEGHATAWRLLYRRLDSRVRQD
jgi:hypothetical protein